MSKEQQTNEKAEGIVKNFLSGKIYHKISVIFLTVRDLITIFVPFGVATYILHTQVDRLVLGLGVAIGLFGFVTTVKLAYGYENRTKKRR